MTDDVIAIKDEKSSHPIASNWRSIFSEVILRFVEDDFALAASVEGVSPVAPDVATHNKEYIGGYGERLAPLSGEVWNSSCAQWMGEHWDVLIDLCTENEGVSDLVLTGKVSLVEGKPNFVVGLIYVP